MSPWVLFGKNLRFEPRSLRPWDNWNWGLRDYTCIFKCLCAFALSFHKGGSLPSATVAGLDKNPASPGRRMMSFQAASFLFNFTSVFFLSPLVIFLSASPLSSPYHPSPFPIFRPPPFCLWVSWAVCQHLMKVFVLQVEKCAVLSIPVYSFIHVILHVSKYWIIIRTHNPNMNPYNPIRIHNPNFLMIEYSVQPCFVACRSLLGSPRVTRNA